MTAELAIALPVAVLCVWAWWRVHDALSRLIVSLARKELEAESQQKARPSE